MRLAQKTQHLLQKRFRDALKPAEILAGSTLATLVFAAAYGCSTFGIRYTDKTLSSLGIVVGFVMCVVATMMAVLRLRHKRPARSWIAATVLLWHALVVGTWLGNRYWWTNMVKYYTWRDMASYVNIDPDMDKGQSYMDAGTVYFKEGSYVLGDHSIAFRNGATYCVAPVVRASPQANSSTPQLQTVNGFQLPRSGTVDFWAVGTDCCGSGAFECGDASSPIARSGLRILDKTSQSMYLLGVQEWSATTGLPVRHPLFFSWVKDPIRYTEDLQSACAMDFVTRLTLCLFGSLVVSVMIHNVLKKFRVT